MIILFNLLLLLINSSIEPDKYYNLKVVGLSDGDTYSALYNKEEIAIRMDAIDAPEKGMPYWKKSKQFLATMIFNKEVRIKIIKQDQHGRWVGRTYLTDGTDVSAEMIKAGYAWHYKKYNSEQALADLEENARKNRLGLWQDPHPYDPATIRAMHRKGISTKSLFQDQEK